eukprot:CAMPEP_0176277866 /NCGR_PEP_ID=MMETSP0121_2-20121125/48496_1 /TAXON_ID=160619 /ORGANISM="Kryptoperidinium foliaceum, Strain CCMP 1326" /LENGTH=91 /DNA_ID=CAMNT_0017618175 /DNA_START=32 /DNA_END=305 /DNA_ORIENTATION=-
MRARAFARSCNPPRRRWLMPSPRPAAAPSSGRRPWTASAPDVRTSLLEVVAQTQRAQEAQREHDDDAEAADPSDDGQRGDDLRAQLVAAVE